MFRFTEALQKTVFTVKFLKLCIREESRVQPLRSIQFYLNFPIILSQIPFQGIQLPAKHSFAKINNIGSIIKKLLPQFGFYQ